MRAEGDAVADEQADVLGIGQAIYGGEQARRRILREQVVERGFGWNFSDGQDTLKHLETDEGFEEFFVGEIDSDVLGSFGEEGLEFRQTGFGQDDGFDGEMTFEETLDDFIAFGHEDALRGVFGGTAQGAVGREFGRVEGGDGLNAEHIRNVK